ncbi:MAG: bifunctional helix-turn-helix domain-containing protein/methylated-DNA--[protein]-cysteine S-methyltransferase [Pseudomonadota bacterium]
MLDTGYHYHVMARAIDFIDTHATEQPSLEDVAAAAGLSPAHFQRIFSQWVGVSPKRYQQYLTLDHAKRLLAERATLLDAAAETGLSGSSRLHDLFLRWEAMTPGAYARAGDGLEIRWGRIDTPFGPAILMATERGIAALGFFGGADEDMVRADLMARWPAATYRHDPTAIRQEAQALFEAREASLHLIGAPFQIKVWEALLQVPTGHVTTYSTIAAAIGHPKAVRAVGTAVGRNPISWLIPCHRALRKSGALGGYHWGLPVKRAMLAWEAARHEAGDTRASA